jgi:hypothetical protein
MGKYDVHGWGEKAIRGMGATMIAVFLGGLFLINIVPRNRVPYSETPRNADEKTRLACGKLIGRALVSFARDHKGSLPENLDMLKPKHLAANVPTSDFKLFYGGEALEGKVLIASDSAAVLGRKGVKRMVLIRAEGDAYLLTPGE